MRKGFHGVFLAFVLAQVLSFVLSSRWNRFFVPYALYKRLLQIIHVINFVDAELEENRDHLLHVLEVISFRDSMFNENLH